MPKLRRLTGANALAIYAKFDFAPVMRRGSHVKLRRMVNGSKQTLTVPLHREIDPGTAKAIYTQALRYVSEQDLRPHFYTSDK